MMYQSQATVYPVASYSALHIQSQEIQTQEKQAKCRDSTRRKKPVAVEDTTSSEAVDELRRVTKAGCQLLSLFQMLKTTKRPAKERTQGHLPIGTLQNTFEREDFVSNGFNSNRGFIYEGIAIEDPC
ncbi:aspartate--tRNA ligase, cytoplasmic-like [Dorcoceras hygrometricum]|uniref:Aspartate--tRNA ligase, cytoplasmic-like n=1 Tax=Dorcoceras hygrometricum TaxID=472368 RepID=A0A2Z7BDR9_9LAMI|nr:aspartate--tRNA ligase, cytoplasmic-like [Dorcoceras hygrometricum]